MHIAYSPPAAYRLIGITHENGSSWLANGLVPFGREGKYRTIGLRGLVAMDLIRRLRSKRVSRPTIHKLTSCLHAMTDEQFAAAISDGQSILVSEGDGLATLASLNESVINMTGRDTLLIAVDLTAIVNRIHARISEFAESAEVTQSN
jgi:hypothetical protein